MAIIGVHVLQFFRDIDVRGIGCAENAGDKIGDLQFNFIKLILQVLPEKVMNRLADFPDFFGEMDTCVSERPALGRVNIVKHFLECT